MTITTFRYVPHGQILFRLATGWDVVDNLIGTNHGHYAVLMQLRDGVEGKGKQGASNVIAYGRRTSASVGHLQAGTGTPGADSSERA